MDSAVTESALQVAPGSVVVVRDEEWLVTGVENTADGDLLRVQGLSELVRGTTASFYGSLDRIVPLDPAQTRLVGDDSPGHRRSRLWLEATVRKAHLPLAETALTVSTEALADPLAYQQSAVRTALSDQNLRPRILLADAVGLGKTLEIGMILSELVRRGRGERILIVCPRHVLEQMQQELWTRFALPFVRLDSAGVQRVKQKLPATRNPFTYYKRVIISMDTLKQARFERDLRRHRWDAVVIDESHNVTNVAAQNNRLARTLAPNTDALILASATPHNGRKESFSELIRLLDPTAVSPAGDLDTDRLEQLVVRRHRNSPEVAQVVGARWAERREPNNLLVPANPAENDVARELDEVWLHPASGASPHSTGNHLFGWTLAKAFLSSPAALAQSITERLRRLDPANPAAQREAQALHRLAELNDATRADSGKYAALVDVLRGIDVHTERAVVFSERVPTLHWLQDQLCATFRLKPGQVEILHGGLSDEEQQRIVDSFKQAASPIRILVTGDVASEGVNLHRQCHELIHYDIPWSLIRLEQRNGRIDRYGQETPPRITTLLLDPDADNFAGDLRVLSRVIEKEHEAHQALGDAAWLMGKESVSAEEDAIRDVLAGRRAEADVLPELDEIEGRDLIADFLAAWGNQPAPAATVETRRDSLYPADVDFLRDAVTEIFVTPEAAPTANGIGWREHPQHGTVEFVPPADLKPRLEVLPQSYLADRLVTQNLVLATTRQRGEQTLRDALSDQTTSSWPEAHYLAPLHPVLEWAADRSLASLGRGQIFAVRGTVLSPTLLLQGQLTNKRGQVIAAQVVGIEFPQPEDNPDFHLVNMYASVPAALAALGFDSAARNPGPIDGTTLQHLVARAVAAADQELAAQVAGTEQATRDRLARWQDRTRSWQDSADRLAQRSEIKQRRLGVRDEEALLADLAPDRRLVRPLLMVVPGGIDGNQ